MILQHGAALGIDDMAAGEKGRVRRSGGAEGEEAGGSKESAKHDCIRI